MARTTPLDDLPLDGKEDGEKPGRWLGRVLREMIRDGRLRAGTRLPSTRRLCAQHGLARGTVVEVFGLLAEEGYLLMKGGSGTFVSGSLPDHFFQPEGKGEGTAAPAVGSGPYVPLSSRGRMLARSPFQGVFVHSQPRAFRAYQPAVDEFPVDVWARLASRRMRDFTRVQMLSVDEFGWLPLREAMADHLAVTRGLACTAEQVMVVTGTQHALDLVTRLLLDPGEEVWMEDPGYPGAAAVFKAVGAKLVPVPVDEGGMQVAVGKRRAPHARLAYVTPANQFPLGSLLTLERRAVLLGWARENGAWIFEDDYDSEFRFTGRPLPALQGLDGGANVIYSCTCNKMLFPTLRLGFLVLPPALVEPVRAARSLLDRFPPMLDQLVLCDFITAGHFGRHLRKMRQSYAERHAILEEEMARLHGLMSLGRCDTGLQTTAWLPPGVDDRMFSQRMLEEKVEVMPLSRYGMKWRMTNGVHLGFAAVDGRELRRGVKAMQRVLEPLAGG